jgi:hypothetical protein
MVLKDASAFNTQFHQGHPTLIDTLSFTRYREGEPWVAYRQFCQHFLAPLVLLHYRDYRLLKLLRSYIDGIPLDLTSSLLPLRSWLRYSLLAHIHLHARAQLHYADAADTRTNHKKPRVSALGMRAMIEGLKNLVARLRPHARESEWDHYYLDTNYEDAAMVSKEGLVSRFLDSDQTTGAILLDLGANTGRFSRLGLAFGYQVIAMDIDENAVEACYRAVRDSNPDSDSHSAGANMLPLVQDLSNPTPALGWAHEERMSLQQRGPVHTVMALALIHHLAIANNVPLQRCAEYFASLGDRLIIEFVPKTDSQVERLLSTREDIFSDYTQAGFERAFGVFFEISQAADIPGSERRIYYFRRRGLAAAIS